MTLNSVDFLFFLFFHHELIRIKPYPFPHSHFGMRLGALCYDSKSCKVINSIVSAFERDRWHFFICRLSDRSNVVNTV